jgi:preprotein translocase subunit SecY
VASGVGNPAATLANATRFGEVRARLLFLLGALIVYRIGTFIPVPGINPAEVARFFEENQGTILGIVNMFSGGAMERLSIFAMGVMPYISASIIVQMASMIYPPWEEYRKEGESGRRKITQITRYFTVVLAVFQSLGAAVALQNGGMVMVGGWSFLFIATVTMTTGTMFLMWLGEQVTERGIGNGISMIILAGIIAGLPSAVGRVGEHRRDVGTVRARPDRPRARRDGVVRVRRACPAPHRRALREAPSRSSCACRADEPPAVQAQHVGRDPADLRLEPVALPGDDRAILWHG